MVYEEMGGLLAKNPVFSGVDMLEISRLLPHFQKREYKAGETIYEEGAEPDNGYLLVKGTINLLSAGKCLEQMKEGVFGEEAGLSGHRYKTTAHADVDSVVYSLPREIFYRFSHKHISAKEALIASLLKHFVHEDVTRNKEPVVKSKVVTTRGLDKIIGWLLAIMSPMIFMFYGES